MSRPTTAVIDLSALRHNLARVRALAPQAQIMAMVKSNAYGHGLAVANQLSEADALGVACLEEALSLRQMGEQGRIVLLEGFFEASELEEIVQHQLDIVVHQAWQVEVLLQAQLALPVRVWLKVDTGMHRLGFLPDAVPLVYQQLQQHPNIQAPVHLMSHFACANERDDASVTRQMQRFDAITQGFTNPKSLANSAAILAYPASHLDWIRPGIMLYGVSPFAEQTASDLGLRPVMHLRSAILAMNDYQAGDYIGYGAEYQCQRPMRVAVVPIGYGDGYPRMAPSGTPVLVNGEHCPLLGRVSMDMLSIDVSKLAKPQIGDSVTLWGDGLAIEHVAAAMGTIAYTLFCGVTRRVHFDYQ